MKLCNCCKMIKGAVYTEANIASDYFSNKRPALCLTLPCKWLSPCWHGEPSAARSCTTASETWSRGSSRWLHWPSFLRSCSDAVQQTRTGSVQKDFKNVEMINMGNRVQMGTNMMFDLRQRIWSYLTCAVICNDFSWTINSLSVILDFFFLPDS